MVDWLKYKGEGPWECIPPNKITYDEGDKTTSVLNPVWVIDQDGITDRTKHDPCGYWPRLPYTPPPVPPMPTFEVYIELLPGETAQPAYDQNVWIWGAETFIHFDINDYDEVVSTELEVIFKTQVNVDIELKLIDTADTVCAEVILPALTQEGVYGEFETFYKLKRLRVPFDPTLATVGDNIFGLKVFVPTSAFPGHGVPCNITNARIVVTQSNPTKTRIQIPMFSSNYVYAMEVHNVDPLAGALAPYDFPIGYRVQAATGLILGADWTNDWGANIAYSDEVTSIWKLEAGVLDNISKVVYSVAAKSHARTNILVHKTWSQTLTSGPTNFNMMLYRAPTTASSAACNTADPLGWVDEFTVHTDTCTGAVFTPIAGSLLHLTSSVDPDEPWTADMVPVFPVGSYKVFFGGTPWDEEWKHYAAYWSMTVKANSTITATMHAYCNVNFIQYYSVDYEIIPEVISNLEVGLWNLTDDIIVPNSIMMWTQDEGFVRKYTEISLIDLKEDCEYEMRVRQPGAMNLGSTSWLNAEIMDAQLLLNINPIQSLSVWYRCFHRYDGSRDDWQIPASWGGNAWEDADLGANSIQHSCYMPIPSGIEAYYSLTAKPDSVIGGDSQKAESQKQYPVSFGAEPEIDLLSGLEWADVGDPLVWEDTDVGHRSLKKGGPIALVNGEYFGWRDPNIEYGAFQTTEGFIILKIK